MKISKGEKIVLNIIKYGPIVFVITLSFILTQTILIDKTNTFKYEADFLEHTFIETNKKRVKEKIEDLYKQISEEKNSQEILLKKEIKQRVNEAHQIALNIYKQNYLYSKNKTPELKQKVLNTIKSALGSIIYNNGKGYFYN